MRSVNNEALLQLEAAVLKAFDEAVDEENRCWNVVDEALKLKLTRTQIGNRPAGMRPDDCPVLQVSRAAQKCLGIELTKYICSSTDGQCADESQHSLDMPLFWRPRHACTFSDRVL